MTNTFERDHPIALPSRMDIGSFETTLDILRRQNGRAIYVDAGNVVHLGAIGLQLLVAATKAAQQRGGKLYVSNPSAAFLQAVADFGVAGDLFEVVT